MNTLIERLIRPEVKALSAYQVADATGMIKLDAMENPYQWPESLRNDWLAALRHAELNRYPDPRAQALRARLRETMSIPSEMGLLLGNGSDELIQMLALAVAAPAADPSRPAPTMLSLDPGFVMYRMIGLFAGLQYVGVELNATDFSLDLEATLTAIGRHQPRLTFIAYPNNPTGNLFDHSAIEQIIQASPGLVILDEAYAPFTDESFLPRLGDWPNLLVMRTVSKMGLAGLRLGYLAGPSDIIAQIDKVRLPYNINVLSQASALFALRHPEVLDEQTQAIRAERARLAEALAHLDKGRGHVTTFPSEANFILLRTQPGMADHIFSALRDQGILIKNLNGTHPQLADCLRITVGLPEENAHLLDALSEILTDS